MRIERVDDAQDIVCEALRERAQAGRREGTEAFLALNEGQEAGLLIYEKFPRHRMALIYEIYVLTPQRGRGVGQRFLIHSENLARAAGYSKIRLSPRSLDRDAISDESLMGWYRRNGFELDSKDSSWMQKMI